MKHRHDLARISLRNGSRSSNHSKGHSKGHSRGLTPSKARKILRDGSIRGHKLTPRQRRYFGLIAGGGKPSR